MVFISYLYRLDVELSLHADDRLSLQLDKQ